MYVSGGYSGFETVASYPASGGVRDTLVSSAIWENARRDRHEEKKAAEEEEKFLSRISDELDKRAVEAVDELREDIATRVYGETDNEDDYEVSLTGRIDFLEGFVNDLLETILEAIPEIPADGSAAAETFTAGGSSVSVYEDNGVTYTTGIA